MKRNFFLAAGAVLLAAAVSASVYVNNGKNSLDELFNANVEALTRGEIGGSGIMCSQSGTPGDHKMPRCTDCYGPKRSYKLDYVAFCN